MAATNETRGGLISIFGDTGDGQIGADGSIAGITAQRDRVGTGGNNVRGLVGVYFFELPTLPSGVTINDVELRFEYVEIERVPEFNIDLFGIDARSDAIIKLSDYYDGIATLSPDTLIQTSVITNTTSLGNFGVANSSLFNFVNSLYNADGTPISTFAAFRLNPDKDLPPGSGSIRGYWVALADNTNATFRPRLDLTVVPEPSSITLLGMGIVSLIGYGWQRKRKLAA